MEYSGNNADNVCTNVPPDRFFKSLTEITIDLILPKRCMEVSELDFPLWCDTIQKDHMTTMRRLGMDMSIHAMDESGDSCIRICFKTKKVR